MKTPTMNHVTERRAQDALLKALVIGLAVTAAVDTASAAIIRAEVKKTVIFSPETEIPGGEPTLTRGRIFNIPIPDPNPASGGLAGLYNSPTGFTVGALQAATFFGPNSFGFTMPPPILTKIPRGPVSSPASITLRLDATFFTDAGGFVVPGAGNSFPVRFRFPLAGINRPDRYSNFDGRLAVTTKREFAGMVTAIPQASVPFNRLIPEVGAFNRLVTLRFPIMKQIPGQTRITEIKVRGCLRYVTNLRRAPFGPVPIAPVQCPEGANLAGPVMKISPPEGAGEISIAQVLQHLLDTLVPPAAADVLVEEEQELQPVEGSSEVVDSLPAGELGPQDTSQGPILWNEHGEENGLPQLADVPRQSVAAGGEARFTVSATDADGETVRYRLVDPPAWASIDADGGEIRLTPTVQDVGMHTLTVEASDGREGLEGVAQGEVEIVVNDVDYAAPLLEPVDTMTINEDETLEFSVSANDPAGASAGEMRFSLIECPTGTTIDPVSGAFAWTPTEAQGPGVYPCKARTTRTDEGRPDLYGETDLLLSVEEVNEAPTLVLPAIPATIAAGQTLAFIATTGDPDRFPGLSDTDPLIPVSYGLEGAPDGASIDAYTGEFTWTPSAAQAGTHVFTVRVEDHEELSDGREIRIEVEPGIVTLETVVGNTYIFDRGSGPIKGKNLTVEIKGGGLRSWNDNEYEGNTILGPLGAAPTLAAEDPAETPGSKKSIIFSTLGKLSDLDKIFEVSKRLKDQSYEVMEFVDKDPNDLDPEDATAAKFIEVLQSKPGILYIFAHGADVRDGALVVEDYPDTPEGEKKRDEKYDTYIKAKSFTAAELAKTEENGLAIMAAGIKRYWQENDTIVFAGACKSMSLAGTFSAREYFGYKDCPVGTRALLDAALIFGSMHGELGEGRFRTASAAFEAVKRLDKNTALNHQHKDGKGPTVLSPIVKTHEPEDGEAIRFKAKEMKPVHGKVVFDTRMDTKTDLKELLTVLGNCKAELKEGSVKWTSDTVLEFDLVLKEIGATSIFVSPKHATSGTGFKNMLDGNEKPSMNGVAPNGVGPNGDRFLWQVKCVEDISTNTQNLDEGSTLTLTNTLSVIGAPNGATFDPITPVFSWTPAEDQGPGVYNFERTTIDQADPNTSYTQAVTVTVNEVNQAPVLAPVSNQTVGVGNPATFVATATDADLPANALIFSLVGAPSGVAIDPTSGGFSWTPSAPGTYTFTVRVTDNGNPSLFAEQAVTVTVIQVNRPPVLAPIGSRTINEGDALSFTATATDADTPRNTLTFSLVGAPETDPKQEGPAQTPGSKKAVIFSTKGQAFEEFDEQLTNLRKRLKDQGYEIEEFVDPDRKDLDPGDVTAVKFHEVLQSKPGILYINSHGGNKSLQVEAYPRTPEGKKRRDDNLDAYINYHEIFNENELRACSHEDAYSICLDQPGIERYWKDDDTIVYAGFCFSMSLADTLKAREYFGYKDCVLGIRASLNLAEIFGRMHGALEDGKLRTASAAFNAGAGLTELSHKPRADNIVTVLSPGVASHVPAAGKKIRFPSTTRGKVVFDTKMDTFADKTKKEQQDLLSKLITATGCEAKITEPKWTLDTVLEFDLELKGEGKALLTVDGKLATSGTGFKNMLDGNFNPAGKNRVGPNGDPFTWEVECVKASSANISTIDEGSTLTLTNTLGVIGAPNGATFDPVTRVFSWTPAEDQGPGVYDFERTTIDQADPNTSYTETVTVTVNEVNQAPVLASIANQTVDVGNPATFVATASDDDLPVNALTFSLVGAPSGAATDPTSGGFSWTPTAPGTYPFTVRVTDDGSPSLFAEQSFTITVNQTNHPPVLAPIGSRTINEGAPLSFTATVSDPDTPPNTLTFSLVGAPDGATIDPTRGAFNWTPSEAHGPGSYPFTIQVTDDGEPPLSDSEEITVTVNEVNEAPVLDPIGDQTVDVGSSVTFVATASDDDLPDNALTFRLVGAPSGATIDPSSGGFFWRPSAPGTYTLVVRVTDDGSPSLFAEQAVTITVNQTNHPPVLVPIDIDNPSVVVGSPVTFTASGTDSDIPLDVLTFTLEGDSHGATIDPTSGAFTWTPSAAGSYTFTVRATDDGGLFAEQVVTVVVVEGPVGTVTPTVTAGPRVEATPAP